MPTSCRRTAQIVVLAYMLNPYAIMSCVGMTTTPLTNLLVALALLNAAKAPTALCQHAVLNALLIAGLAVESLLLSF